MDWRAIVESWGLHGSVVDLVALAAAGLLAAFIHFTLGTLVRRALHKLVKSTRFTWDDALLDSRVLHRLVHLIPLAVIHVSLQPVRLSGALEAFVERTVTVLLVVLVARVLDALLDAAHSAYTRSDVRKAHPIKGYVQVAKIFLWAGAVVIAVAAAADRSPLLFLSGIGALTALVLLVFKDTILGLVASVQLSGNDMLRVGDWIEMSSAGADGDVIDIALLTVKVQNWDKTITTVPTYSLISAGFKNWRSMGEAGGRRIKRALVVENASVRHLTDDEIERLGKVELIHDYIVDKQRSIQSANAAAMGGSGAVVANLRRLTNIGTYRAYLVAYLRAHPDVHETFTCMVRQLAPLPQGQPLEIYCFTKTTKWVEYEGIQSDIFDHALAIASEFGLRIYQAPSSDDVRALRGALPDGAPPHDGSARDAL